LTVQTGNPRQIQLLPQVLNPVTGQATLTAGGPAMLFTLNLAAGTTASSLTLTLNDQPLQISNYANGQITFGIPLGTPSGPGVLRLRSAGESAQPIVVNVDPPPPVILAMQASGAPVDASRPVRAGDTIIIAVSGLAADGFTGIVARDGLTVSVGGVEHAPLQVNALVSQRGIHEVVFTLKDTIATGAHALTVTQDFRTSSAPVLLPVR
jgi:uncharacterized protein (TIGR03437 family)